MKNGLLNFELFGLSRASMKNVKGGDVSCTVTWDTVSGGCGSSSNTVNFASQSQAVIAMDQAMASDPDISGYNLRCNQQ